MSHHDIHEIITQISQTMTCPRCKSRILPHNIVITEIVNDDCYFDVACKRCHAEMTLSAHIEKTLSDEAMTFNRSSQILHDQVVQEGISAEEVEAMRRALKNFCGSFDEAFDA